MTAERYSRAELRRRYEAGQSLAELGAWMGCAPSTALRRLRVMGAWRRAGDPASPKRLEMRAKGARARELRRAGLGWPEIGQALGCSARYAANLARGIANGRGDPLEEWAR